MFLRMANGRTGQQSGCEYWHAPVTPTRGGPTCRVASLPSTSDLCNSRACAGQFRIGTFRACFENPRTIRKRNFSGQLPQLVRPRKYKHIGIMPSPVDRTGTHIRTSGKLRRMPSRTCRSTRHPVRLDGTGAHAGAASADRARLSCGTGGALSEAAMSHVRNSQDTFFGTTPTAAWGRL